MYRCSGFLKSAESALYTIILHVLLFLRTIFFPLGFVVCVWWTWLMCFMVRYTHLICVCVRLCTRVACVPSRSNSRTGAHSIRCPCSFEIVHISHLKQNCGRAKSSNKLAKQWGGEKYKTVIRWMITTNDVKHKREVQRRFCFLHGSGQSCWIEKKNENENKCGNDKCAKLNQMSMNLARK